MANFNTSFSEPKMWDFFQKHLWAKKGGGRDHISPSRYFELYKNQATIIANKCISGKYIFAPYTEKLINKGRNKFPRIISIPTIRDRWVLGILAQYIREQFADCVSRDLPNAYIVKIQNYIKENKDHNLYFLKTDISSFYDNIVHNKLISILQSRITNDNVIKLIRAAITNTTIPISAKDKNTNQKGVPQGLAISNILAQIYLHDYDTKMSGNKEIIAFRYVDDILVLSTKYKYTAKNIIDNYFSENDLGLYLSKEKTQKGRFNNTEFCYLGYQFSNGIISVRQTTLQNFIHRIAAKCTLFRDGYKDKHKRPRYLIDDDKGYINTFIYEMNVMICGAKFENRIYGWLPYFIQISDIRLIYRLDSILKKLLTRTGCFKAGRPKELNSFAFSFYQLKYNNGKKSIIDYNLFTTIEAKRDFLKKHGQIDSTYPYSTDQINTIFEKYRMRNLKDLEIDMNVKYM